MSSKQMDARQKADWNWDDWNEETEDAEEEDVFKVHHCDPSDWY